METTELWTLSSSSMQLTAGDFGLADFIKKS